MNYTFTARLPAVDGYSQRLRDLDRMRNRLLHGSLGVGAAVVWETCGEDLPGLDAPIRPV